MSTEGPLIGYCHTCDRQIEIDRNEFSCKNCNGGFVELFEIDNQQQQQQQQTSGPGYDGHQSRSIRLNAPGNIVNV